MGGFTVEKVVWLSFVVSSGSLLLNATTDIEMSKRPANKILLMLGEKLELQWNYDVHKSAGDQWMIGLYVGKDKEKLKLIDLKKSGNVRARPVPHKYEHIHIEISHNSTKLWISSTIFNDTASYVFFFKKSASLGNYDLEVVAYVKIVDMFFDEENSSTVERTWFGEPVTFVCSIILKDNADSPSFRWKNVEKNLTISTNVVEDMQNSSLTITPQDESDFGAYKCYIETRYTKIKHNMTLIKIDRPKSPVFIKFSARKRSLEWKAVRKSVFVVQLLKNREKCKWINVTTTSKLAVSLHSLNEYFPENTIDTCSVRICLKEKQGSVNASCSHEHRLYSKISPRPNIKLVSKPSKKAILSWQRQNYDEAEIVGYVIQMFHGSTQNFASIHVDDKRPHGKHTFSNTDTIKHALLRVCIRNTLCIFERSCSRKVGLLPVFPSEPRSIKIQFYNNVSDVKISWKKPSVIGKGSLFYVIQIKNKERGKWKREVATKELETTIISPASDDHVRVCAANNVDYKKISCSQSYDLEKERMKILESRVSGSTQTEAKVSVFLVVIFVFKADIILWV